MRKTKKERTGGLGSREQFAKFTEIVQEGTEITPEVAENMQGFITSPSLVQGPGTHDPTNITSPKTSTQQLTELTGTLGNVVKAKVEYNDGTKRRQAARDTKLQKDMAGTIANEQTAWEKERNKWFTTQTLRAKNYLDGDRLNQITKVNPQTGEEEIDWSLLTDREAFLIYKGIDGTMLKGKTPEQVQQLYDSLPIAWNRAAQRKWMTDQWNTLESEMQTSEGTADFILERSTLLNNNKEMNASEVRAALIGLIKDLDDNPNINPEQADKILDSWIKGIYLMNPGLERDGVVQSIIDGRLEYASKLFVRTRVEDTTTWWNDQVKEGIRDLFIGQIYTHVMSGADPDVEDEPWTLEDMPPSYIADKVTDSMLANKADPADIINPEIITSLMEELDLRTDDGILNSVSEVERDWVYNQVYPVIAKRMAQEKAIRRKVANQVEFGLLVDQISRPSINEDGNLEEIDWQSAFPSIDFVHDDPTQFAADTTKLRDGFKIALMNRSQAIATDPDIPWDERVSASLEVYSDENIRGISDGYHTAIGTYIGMNPEDKEKALASEAKMLKEGLLIDHFKNTVKFEVGAGVIRLQANLDDAELKNALSDTVNGQFTRSLGNMDPYLDKVYRLQEVEQQFMRTGDSVLPVKTDYFHPLNMTEDEMNNLGVPPDMQDSFSGIGHKEWIDDNGVTHHKFEEIDPASPAGQAVTEILKTVREKYASSKVRGTLDRNVGGRAPKNDQNKAVTDILNADNRMNLSFSAAPKDSHEIPSATTELLEDIKEAEHLKWTGVSQLIPNLNHNGELSDIYKQTLITAMQDPKAFYSLILPMYITDENGKYYVHDMARSSIKANLIDSTIPKYRELGWLFEYLDETLTIAGGELPTDPEERQQALMASSTLYDLSTDTMTLIDAAKEYGKTQELIKKVGLNEQVLDAMNDKETDIALKKMFNLTATLLGEGGFFGRFEQPDSFMEANQNLLDPETAQDFMLEMAVDYVREYKSQGPVDDEGERKDFSLDDWVTMKLNQKMTTEGWGTFVSRGGSAVYFVKDPKRYLSGETHRAAFDTLLISYSQVPIVDIPDHNNPLMTYISTDVAPGVIQNTLDSIEQGILDTHVSYMIDDPTFLLKEDGTPSDNEFMSNIWIAHPAVIEFYNTTEDLKLSGEYATRHENSDYTIAANNLISAINNGAIKIPGTLDEKGNWESHTVFNSPSMIQLDINNYTYKDVVSDWIDITGAFPTQRVYGLIGNEIKTRADVYMYAIDTWRGALDLPSMHARFTPLRGDRIRVVPNTELSNAQLGIYRNEPIFRDKKENETAIEYDNELQIFTQTELREYQMNRNGYPVNLMITDPSGRNPQPLPSLYRKDKHFINGEWVLTPTRKPVVMINTNHPAVTNELTRKQLTDNPGKSFTINRVSPQPKGVNNKATDNFIAPSKLDFVFPPEVWKEPKGKITLPGDFGRYAYEAYITWDWAPGGDKDNPILTVQTQWGSYLYSPTISETTKNLLTTDLN